MYIFVCYIYIILCYGCEYGSSGEKKSYCVYHIVITQSYCAIFSYCVIVLWIWKQWKPNKSTLNMPNDILYTYTYIYLSQKNMHNDILNMHNDIPYIYIHIYITMIYIHTYIYHNDIHTYIYHNIYTYIYISQWYTIYIHTYIYHTMIYKSTLNMHNDMHNDVLHIHS